MPTGILGDQAVQIRGSSSTSPFMAPAITTIDVDDPLLIYLEFGPVIFGALIRVGSQYRDFQ